MQDLPKALRDVMEQLLEADAGSDHAPAPRSNVERIEALRAARIIVAQWRRGDIDVSEAVGRIDALVALSRP